MTVDNGNVCRVTAKMSVDSNDIQNVFHVVTVGAGGHADFDWLEECAQWVDDVYATVEAQINEAVLFDTVEAYNMTKDEYIGEIGFPELIDGGDESDMLPIQCAALVLFQTPTLRSQGRKFLPPFGEGWSLPDGSPSPGAITQMGFFAAVALAGFQVDLDDCFPGNYRISGGAFIPWTNGLVQDFYATQRRRYRGSGS